MSPVESQVEGRVAEGLASLMYCFFLVLSFRTGIRGVGFRV